MYTTTVTNDDGTSTVDWFDSPAEFARAAEAVPESARFCPSWWTGEDWGEASRRAASGRLDRVADAEKLLEELQAEVVTPRSEWVASRAGSFPCVPEALAGFPEPMRRRVVVPSDKAPIRVFVDLVSSAGIEHEHLERRGVAALALAMALGAERSVELHAVVGEGDRSGRKIVVMKIPSAPLDLATACNALTSIGLIRGLGYSYCTAEHKHWDWAFGYYPSDDGLRAKYVRQLRAALGASDADLVLPPTFLTDPAVKDPVGFVRRGVAEHGGRDEAFESQNR